MTEHGREPLPTIETQSIVEAMFADPAAVVTEAQMRAVSRVYCEQIAKIAALAWSDEADKFRDEACRHVVDQPYADNRYVRLLDALRDRLPVTPSQ